MALATNIVSQTQLDQLIIDHILPDTLLAPSAHNTQPWNFKLTKQGVDLFIDWSRHLHVSDPTHRQTYVSLGCALTNTEASAASHGLSTNFQFFPLGTSPQDPVVSVSFSPLVNHQSVDLKSALHQRRTDRSLFDQVDLTESEKASLGSRRNSNSFFLTDKKLIKKIADLAHQATGHTLANKDFKHELSRWVRNSLTRQPDGMPGYAVGMPTPVSFFAPIMVRFAPIHKQEAPKIQKQVESSSALLIFATSEDNPQSWLEAGRLLERAWLEATVAGLAAMPITAPIEAGQDIRGQVANLADPRRHPQAILRIGHSQTHKELKNTPRRSLEDCLL